MKVHAASLADVPRQVQLPDVQVRDQQNGTVHVALVRHIAGASASVVGVSPAIATVIASPADAELLASASTDLRVATATYDASADRWVRGTHAVEVDVGLRSAVRTLHERIRIRGQSTWDPGHPIVPGSLLLHRHDLVAARTGSPVTPRITDRGFDLGVEASGIADVSYEVPGWEISLTPRFPRAFRWEDLKGPLTGHVRVSAHADSGTFVDVFDAVWEWHVTSEVIIGGLAPPPPDAPTGPEAPDDMVLVETARTTRRERITQHGRTDVYVDIDVATEIRGVIEGTGRRWRMVLK